MVVHDEVLLTAAVLALVVVAFECDCSYALPCCCSVKTVALPKCFRVWPMPVRWPIAACAYRLRHVSVQVATLVAYLELRQDAIGTSGCVRSACCVMRQQRG
jgi:hypothetical protein